LDVIHNFHFVALVFVLLVALMLILGKVRPRTTAWVHEDSGQVDLTPWKGAIPSGIVLIVLVIAIYLAFAG
ncbi:solute:sodium symporter family transporter, partial [Halomonas sp. BBD48]|nr:solute:sodium symporter family transporter [Halomonas sp. BBD48]